VWSLSGFGLRVSELAVRICSRASRHKYSPPRVVITAISPASIGAEFELEPGDRVIK